MSETPDEQTQEQDGPEPDEQPTPIQPPDEQAEEEEAGESEATEGHEAEGEQEAPSGPAGAVGEKELEKMFKRVETANAAYARKLSDIMAEEAQVLEPCPRCSDPFLGFIFPPLMKPASAETKAAVLVSVGEEPASATEPDPYSRRCDACKGSGRVLSGSKLNTEKALVCLPCKGKGWVAVGDERRVAQQAVPVPAAVNGGETPIEQPPDTDPWGRPPTDPDYGRLPNFVGAS